MDKCPSLSQTFVPCGRKKFYNIVTRGISLKPLTKIDYAECTIGNAIADSMLAGQWAKDATISFINNGGIRDPIHDTLFSS
jgi:hypothetical protein